MGAEVQTWTGRVRKAMRAMGARRGRLSAPWPRFHGVDRADVYIIIHVRACCCGECELNPPPSPPIPRRRSSLPPPHSDTPFPSTSAPPRSPDARRQAARCIPRRPTTPSPPTAQPILRRRPSLAPAQRHALAEHFRPPRSADARPRSADARPQAARCTPADRTTHSPQRNAASPSVPLRTQKNGTAQCMCDAECLGRPSLRSVIGVGEPRAVRRRFGALAWRVGLRPQPWALRSRRCGRVLRA